MPLKLKRSRNVSLVIPKVRVSRGITRRAAAKRLAKSNIRNVRYSTTNDARPRPWRRIRKIGGAATPRLLRPHLAAVARSCALLGAGLIRQGDRRLGTKKILQRSLLASAAPNSDGSAR
jgi:hypothetical protein